MVGKVPEVVNRLSMEGVALLLSRIFLDRVVESREVYARLCWSRLSLEKRFGS